MRTEQIITVTDKNTGESVALTGVTSVTLESALQTEADGNEKTAGAVNHALNEPDRLTASVTVTDTAPTDGRTAGGICAALLAMKRDRRLLRVTAPMAVYTDMLLCGITVIESSECAEGWRGELTFQQAKAANGKAKKSTGTQGSGRRGAVAPAQAADLDALPLL